MVHVLVGLPGSGKTRFRKMMQRKEGWRAVSRDDIRRCVFGVEYDPALEDQVDGVYWEMGIELLASTNSQLPVCLDCTHLTKKAREDAIALARLGGTCVAHVFEVDPEVCWRQKKYTRKGSVRSEMTRQRFDELAKSFEPVTEGEGFDEIIVHRGRKRA